MSHRLHFNSSFNREIRIIHPGEYYATKDEIYISTVLGSCVSVVLFDSVANLGGMNHFMLPKPHKNQDIQEGGKYGIQAMELLLNNMIKLGSKKSNLIAKVFGGGSVLPGPYIKSFSVPENNIKFAFSFLNLEKIPVISSDVGGHKGRKIFLDPKTSKVFVRKLAGRSLDSITEEELEYMKQLDRASKDWGDYIIFD